MVVCPYNMELSRETKRIKKVLKQKQEKFKLKLLGKQNTNIIPKTKQQTL